jgi:glucokinase
MASSTQGVLLGDIGATNARFAVLADDTLGPIAWFEVAQYPAFADALHAFLDRHRGNTTVSAALLAVAGPVENGRCALTNSSWTIDGSDLRDRFGLEAVHVVNDFEATALSLPQLAGDDLYRLGRGNMLAGAPMAVLGPGSGLGVAGLVPGSQARVIVSEGGHATVPGTSRHEDAVIDHLRGRFGHVSAERVISGPGLENLYGAIATIDGVKAPLRNAAEITEAALKAACPTARAALDMFCAMLGTFAGNVALTFGARGGIFIAGGIAPRVADYLARSEFRSRFENKGRFRPYLAAIPTYVITHAAATFLGLQSLARHYRDTSA